MAVPFFIAGGRAHGGAIQQLPCAYGLFAALRQGSGPFPAAMPRGERLTVFCAHSFWQSLAGGHCPPHAPRDFLHGGRPHKSAVQWLLCAYGLFAGLWQGSGQFPPQCLQGTAERLSPFVWAVRRIPGRKKIPYPVSFGIRHFEKGVNERGNQPCQPICASTNRHT